MQIPSFREYILINSTNVHVTAGRKQADDSWKFEEIKDLDSELLINSIGHSIPLREIYANVKF